MNPYIALIIYVDTLIYAASRLRSKNPINRMDFLAFVLSYAFFGLAWVIEGFTK